MVMSHSIPYYHYYIIFGSYSTASFGDGPYIGEFPIKLKVIKHKSSYLLQLKI